jgi:glycosyltransferase involved in cell wall biosynthesis
MISSTPQPAIRIAIDGNEANVSSRVGSNVYAFEIIKHLEAATKQDRRYTFTVLLSSPPSSDLPTARPGWSYNVVTPRPLWTQWALPIHLFLHKQAYDVLFTPGHYAPRLSSIPYVSSVMDLGFLEYPKQFKKNDLMQLTNWTAYSVKHAAKIVAISEFTKHDVCTTYGRKPEDVVVAHPSVATLQLPTGKYRAQTTLSRFDITKPYLLYVGTLQPRKNIERLIAAFERLHRQINSGSIRFPFSKKNQALDYHNLKLVLAGKTGWLAEPILERIKKSPVTDHIILTGFISAHTKTVLIKHAEALALVGLYEGFGIPALEALHLGTIPVVSDSSSLPEVVGKAGVLVNPRSTTSIAKGLADVLTTTASKKAQLVKEGRKQIKKFSWEHSSQIILDTLTKVATRA